MDHSIGARLPDDPAAGVAAGTPYVVLPPAPPTRRRAPLVVAWHGLEAPRSERAMAAALPLARLAAWRVYLRLRRPGVRASADPLAPEQALLRLDAAVAPESSGPVVEQAVAALPAVVAALRARLPLASGPIGLLGCSLGATAALLALTEDQVPVRAAALVRPVVQVERLGLLARAPEIAKRDPQPAVLVVTGLHEDPGIGEPAERLWQALADRYRAPGRVALLLAPELASRGTDAPQVDAAVTDWFGRHLAKLT
jgi:alpha-beta hydrolase superfamily lysophospholipase